MPVYVDEEKTIGLRIGQAWLIDNRGYTLIGVSLKDGVLFRGTDLSMEDNSYGTAMTIEQLREKMKSGEAFHWVSIRRSRELLVRLAIHYKNANGISHDTEVSLAEVVDGMIQQSERCLC